MVKPAFLIIPNQEQDFSNNDTNQTNVILIKKNGNARGNWAKKRDEDIISSNHEKF